MLRHTGSAEGMLFAQAEGVSLFERVDEDWDVQVAVANDASGHHRRIAFEKVPSTGNAQIWAC